MILRVKKLILCTKWRANHGNVTKTKDHFFNVFRNNHYLFGNICDLTIYRIFSIVKRSKNNLIETQKWYIRKGIWIYSDSFTFETWFWKRFGPLIMKSINVSDRLTFLCVQHSWTLECKRSGTLNALERLVEKNTRLCRVHVSKLEDQL